MQGQRVAHHMFALLCNAERLGWAKPMNVNTVYFRVALSIAAIWIAAFAYMSYSGYRQAYRSTEYASFSVPEEDAYKCMSKVLDATKQNFQFREQTSEERSECYRKAAQEHIRLIESSNQFAFEQAWKSFGWIGALPALLLLAVVALWKLISTTVGSAGSAYFNWLRYGSTKPNNGNTDSEP